MSVIDLFIILFVVLVVARGARTGFLAGVFSLAGVVLGVSLGSRLAPLLIPENEGLVFRAGVTLASILAFAVLGDVLARAIGRSIKSRLRGSASTKLDGLGGAVLGLVLSLTLVWVVGLFVLQAPTLAGIHPTLRDSQVLQALNKRMPSQFFTEAVAKLDPLPQIRAPKADVEDPEEGIVQDPEVIETTSSAVRVTGLACGYGVEGSGWVAAPNLVVTNAHVVAGTTVTRVQTGGTGPQKRARVVFFDEKNDIAVLRVRRLGLPSLPLADPEVGEPVAILGFPENGPLDVRPGRTGETRRVISTDAYNNGPVERTVTSFRVYVRPGNSGGPSVNGDGEVVSTIFASRAGSSNSGYGVPSQLIQERVDIAAQRRAPVSNGKCIN